MNDMTVRDEMSVQTDKTRTPEQIGAEIRMYVNTGRWITTLCGIEIGRRLVEAKELLPHGEWLPWLQRETEFSERSAQDYMRVFKDYSATQLGLFGPETNTQTFADLPISKALALLSVPESDREAFAKEVDAEHISVRELKQAIKERDEALAREKKIREERDLSLQNVAELNEKAEEREKELVGLRKNIEELEKRPVEVAVETVRDEEAIAAAAKEAKEKAEAAAKKKITDLEKKLNKAENERAEAVEKAESAGKDAEKKLKEATAAAEKIKADLEEARKQLKASDADITAFGIRFNTLQNEFGYMIAEYRKVAARDPETADKLHEAARQLIEYFTKELEKKEDEANV